MKPLTKREWEVMQLIAQGYSNKESAEILRFSVKTLEKHKQSIYHKWKVNNVVAMVRVAIKQNELSVESFLSSEIGENTSHEVPHHKANRLVA